MSLLRVVVGGVLALAMLWTLAHAVGAWRWHRLTRDLHARLDAATADEPPGNAGELPPPVARYLQRALPAGAAAIAAVRIRHAGEFDVGGGRWRRFDSVQRVSTHPPGFDWDARVRLAPGLPIRVHDAYVAGDGLLRASVLGLFDVASLQGGGAIAEGELMRWLAEAAWYPTALGPQGPVRWTVRDARSARAHLRDGATAIALDVHFGDDGLIRRVRAEARGRAIGDRIVPTPWEGRFWDYRAVDGMLVPGQGEVGWIVDGRFEPYWRGRVVLIDHAYAAHAQERAASAH